MTTARRLPCPATGGRLPSRDGFLQWCWPLALLTTVFILGYHEIWDRDIFFHLATGEAMLDRGGLLRENVFTWPQSSLPFYPNPAWLFDALIALVYRAAGLPGVVIGKCLVLLGLFWAALRLLRQQGMPLPAAAGLLSIVAMASAFRFNERPEIFTFLFLALYAALVERHRRQGGKAIWWLPALMVVWTNMHAGFIFGLIYLYLVLAGEVLTAWAGKRPGGRERNEGEFFSWGLAAAVAATTAACAVTPNLVGNFRFLFQHLHVTEIVPVAEYASPDPRLLPWFYVLLAALAGLAVLGRRRWRLATVLPLLFFLGLAFHSVRFIPLFGIACLPWAGEQFPLRWQRTGGAQAGPRGRIRRAAALLAVAPVLVAVLVPPVPGSRFGVSVDRTFTPVDAFRFLGEAGFSGNLYNSLSFGAAGMFYLYPRYRLFQTSYIQVEEDLMAEAYRAAKAPADWHRFLERYSIEVALIDVRHEAPSPDFFPPDLWAMVYFDDVSAIFVRRGAANEDLVRRYEYRIVHPARFFGAGEGTAAVDTDRVEEGIAELRRALRWSPESPQLHLMLGYYLNAAPGREGEALKAFARAAEIDPELAAAYFQMGVLLLEQGAYTESISTLKAYVRLAPDDPFGYLYLARSNVAAGEPAKGITALRQGVQAATGAGILYGEMGKLQRQGGELENALESFQSALRFEANDPVLFNEYGITLGMAGRLQEAVEAFERALELAPGFGEARQNRSYALQLMRGEVAPGQE